MSKGVGVAPGTTTLTLPDGQQIMLVDWIDDKIFGSVELEDSDTSAVEAYSNGRSQPIPGGTRAQTKVDTNIPKAGDSGLPKDWEMLVYGWGVEFVRTAATATLAAASTPVTHALAYGVDRLTAFDYQYNGKSYTTGRISDYPRGGGLVAQYFTTANATTFDAVNNGSQSPRDRVALVLPVHEREGLGYKAVLQPESALDIGTSLFMDLRVIKNGLIKRTVV